MKNVLAVSQSNLQPVVDQRTPTKLSDVPIPAGEIYLHLSLPAAMAYHLFSICVQAHRQASRMRTTPDQHLRMAPPQEAAERRQQQGEATGQGGKGSTEATLTPGRSCSTLPESS